LQFLTDNSPYLRSNARQGYSHNGMTLFPVIFSDLINPNHPFSTSSNLVNKTKQVIYE